MHWKQCVLSNVSGTSQDVRTSPGLVLTGSWRCISWFVTQKLMSWLRCARGASRIFSNRAVLFSHDCHDWRSGSKISPSEKICIIKSSQLRVFVTPQILSPLLKSHGESTDFRFGSPDLLNAEFIFPGWWSCGSIELVELDSHTSSLTILQASMDYMSVL